MTRSSAVEKTFVGLIIVLILHLNDVKISVIRVTELLMIIYGILRLNYFSRLSRRFLMIFLLFVFLTFFHNAFLKFDTHVATSFLHLPYWCTIGRFVELFCCLSFMELIASYIRRHGFRSSIETIFQVNFWFCITILILYVLSVLQIWDLFGVIKYSTRLNGFFNEGGPFGLLMAMFVVLSFLFSRPLYEKAICFSCLFLSFSKAGFMFLLISIAVGFVYRYKRSNKVLLSIGFSVIVLMLAYPCYYLLTQYSSAWFNSDYAMVYAKENPNDLNFVAGRISGRYIAYNMIVQNPIIGIGLGNYPILRNLTEYRGFFPVVRIYDASGFGGIIDILIQQGLLGLLLFFLPLYELYRRNKDKIFIPLFVTIFICGVQLTFMYPWILLAFSESRYKENVLRNLLRLKLQK